MPERYYEDVEKQCSPVTRTLNATNWVIEEEVIMANPGELATFTISQDANAVIAEDGSLHVTAENPNNRTTEISKVLDIIPANKQFSVKTHITNSGQNPIFMQVLQLGENNQWQTLASRTISVEADVDLVSFSKSNTNPLKVLFSTTGATNFGVFDIQLTRRDVLEMEITENLCSYDEDFGDDYRFGFNGQEKDNEIKGTGNSLAYEARIYDSRLGVWLSNDPLKDKYPSVSPYCFGLGSPIQFKDEGGRFITDKNGIPIYNVLVSDHIMKGVEGFENYVFEVEIRVYYTNSGEKFYVYNYHSMITLEDYDKAVANDESPKFTDISNSPMNLRSSCHSNSLFPGQNLYIPGGLKDEDEMVDNIEKVFNDPKEFTPVSEKDVRQGDITTFGVKSNTVDHSATNDGDGTLTSKNDRYPLRTCVTKEMLKFEQNYGDPIRSYRHNGNVKMDVESENGRVSQKVATELAEKAATQNTKKTQE